MTFSFNTREWLVFIAIVTSAVVMQIRQHALERAATQPSVSSSPFTPAVQEGCEQDASPAAHPRFSPATCTSGGVALPVSRPGRVWV